MKTILIAVAILLLVALVGFGAVKLGQLYQRPLAQPLQLSQAESTATPPPEPIVAGVTESPTEPAETPTAEPTVQAHPKKQGACGETGSLMILFTGADFSGGVWPLGADAVRVIKADFDAPAIISVAFPRDLWVQTPALADLDIQATRLGLAYHYKKEATQGENKERVFAATGIIAQTLVDNFNLPANQYLTLQLDSVAEMIDIIDGVPINNPEEFTTEYGVHFPAGPQTLDGRLSAEFVRAYQPGGDPARRKRQTLWVKAMQDRVISTGVLAKLPELVRQFDEAIVTDLSPKQLTALACLANQVPSGKVQYYEIDETLTTPREVGERNPVLDPNVAAILSRLKEWLGR